MELVDADDATIVGLTPDQRALFENFIDFMNPMQCDLQPLHLTIISRYRARELRQLLRRP
jgi:hypothetical protein